MTDSLKFKEIEGPIFIFGAGGFIGSNLLFKILSIRDDVYGIIRNNTNTWRLNYLGIKKEKILITDVLNKSDLDFIFSKYLPKVIFNLTAFGSSSNQNDLSQIYNVNLIGAANILELLDKDCIYINAGSSSEYGYNSNNSNENSNLEPNSHYSVSKIAASFLVSFYSKVHKRLSLNLRLYSIYGQFEEPNRLIPSLIENARINKLPNLVSKTISRDFVFIDDCVDAFLKSVISLTSNPSISGNSYNICSGRMTTIEELINITSDLFNIKEKPVWGSMDNRSWDQNFWYGDPGKTSKDIGWSSIVSISEGLKKCYDWQSGLSYDDLKLSSSIKMKKLSAVIACYKDEDAIPIMYKRLVTTFKRINVDYEIIFVNDSSPDESEKIIDEICMMDTKVIGITHSRNFGSQAAFMSGMELSSGDGVILLDGDLQDPPELIEEFYKKWIEGFDVVYGIRVKREMSFHFNLIYKLFYYLFEKLSYIKMPKNAGDFSLIDRVVVDKLIDFPETEQFLRGLRAWVGYNQTGVEYVRPKRMFGNSTNNLLKNFWWARKAIFSFSFQPLSILSYIGIIFTILSFLGAIIQFILRFILNDIPSGFTTLIILILFFGGINLLALSFIGEYISKIFEETKKRPKFIRKKIITKNQEYKTILEIENSKKNKEKHRLIKN